MATQPTAPAEITVGKWTWREESEDGGDNGLVCEESGIEFFAGDIDAAWLREAALDLMKLASAVAQRP
jgi:hypothetical protein